MIIIAELAVIGDSEFVMGFELIGIKRVRESETTESLREEFASALNDKDVGIIVTNDTSLQKLDAQTKRTILNTVSPVVVVLSDKPGTQDNLRDMIKKAIGIDLLSK